MPGKGEGQPTKPRNKLARQYILRRGLPKFKDKLEACAPPQNPHIPAVGPGAYPFVFSKDDQLEFLEPIHIGSFDF